MGRYSIRCQWVDVPMSVRTEVEDLLGSPIVTATNIDGGFSPGPAVRADLRDGRTVFIKAAGTALNALSPRMHRREAGVLRSLPASVPAPQLIGVVDDGDWVAIVTQWIDGRNPDATDGGDVRRLLAVIERVASHTAPPGLRPFADAHPDLLGNWARLVADPLPDLDDWSRRHLRRLADLEGRAPAAAAGSHLLHVDTRTDNVLLAAGSSDADVVVDWPAACVGAAWIDLVGMLPALHLDGGPPPAEVFDDQPLGTQADPAAVDAVLASISGYFTRQSLLPPPPGIPAVRAFQADQGVIARTWLAQRLQLDDAGIEVTRTS